MRFKRVYIEISNICNMHCSFCSPLKRQKQIMSVEQFDHITTQIQPYCEYVYLHVKGEPLMHPYLSEIMDICERKHLRVNLTTNGTLIPQRKELLFSKPALRQVNLSLHSFSEHDCDEPGFSEDRYVDSLIRFVKEASEHKIISILRLWNLNDDHQADEKSIEIMKKLQNETGYEGDLCEDMAHKNRVKLMPYTFLSWDEQFEWPSMDNSYFSETGRCHGMRDLIAVLVDGSVVPCCLDADGIIRLGNLYQQSFEQILNSDRAKAITEGFRNQKVTEELCRHCTYRKRFDR